MKKLAILITSILTICAIGIAGCSDMKQTKTKAAQQKSYEITETDTPDDLDNNDFDDGNCDDDNCKKDCNGPNFKIPHPRKHYKRENTDDTQNGAPEEELPENDIDVPPLHCHRPRKPRRNHNCVPTPMPEHNHTEP